LGNSNFFEFPCAYTRHSVRGGDALRIVLDVVRTLEEGEKRTRSFIPFHNICTFVRTYLVVNANQCLLDSTMSYVHWKRVKNERVRLLPSTIYVRSYVRIW
jgi:hypothetical protein